MSTGSTTKFPERKHTPTAGTYVRELYATCSGCATTAGVVVTGRAFPPEFVARKLRHAGWALGSRRTRDLCPACAGSARRPVCLAA